MQWRKMWRWGREEWTFDRTTYNAWNERIESKMILIEILLCKYSSDYFLSLIFWLIAKCQEITANLMSKEVPEHYCVWLKTGYRATESCSPMQFHLHSSRLFQLIISNTEDWNVFMVSIQNSKNPYGTKFYTTIAPTFPKESLFLKEISL